MANDCLLICLLPLLRCAKPHKAFPHILSADNCHIRRNSSAHRWSTSKLLQHTSVGKLSYSRLLEFQFLNSHLGQQPVFLIRHECLMVGLNHFH
jgi:hypothetical protein